ncbi:MAG: hypothetical protein SPE04_11415 [Prevotella sp.]|nr:hypothetical protein [Prevotella sp.]
MKICFIIFNDYVTNLVSSTAVREDSGAFCFPFYGHSKRKNPTASRVPTVGNEKALLALGGL